jgi:two-component system sensor histidine kinase BaeS
MARAPHRARVFWLILWAFMKISITTKLFLAVLATAVLAVVAMGAASRWNFERGFLGYLNEQEAQRLDTLQPRLAAAYRQHGSWDFLRDSPKTWFDLLGPRVAGTRQESESAGAGLQGQPDPDLTGLNLRVSLLDDRRRLIIGSFRIGPPSSLRAIVVDGRTVGWLALLPFQEVTSGAGRRFLDEQLRAGWVIAGAALLLAALVAWLLSRMVVAPVKRIAGATRQLASGDYATRVPPGARDELGALAQDFNALALTLGRNEALRRGFMSDVSHELRTPLAVLRGELEAAEDGLRPLSPDLVASLQEEVATLGKLVDDVYELSLSDVGALTYRMAPTDVAALLRAALAGFAPRFAARRIEVTLALPEAALCLADPDRLRQLFNNLLENTLRYTDAGGRLMVRAGSADGRLTLRFDDSAPGVPADKLAQIFERFFRADPSRNRAHGGAGLGLAISRNIVEAHRGSIAASASELGGVCMTVSLPLHTGSQP